MMIIELTLIVLVFLLAFVATRITLSVAGKLKVGSDEFNGRQKLHDHAVSRLGGVPIAAAAFVGLIFWAWITDPAYTLLVTGLIVSSLPVFLAGLVEDFTRKVSAGCRLIFAFVSAALAFWLVDAQVNRTGLEILDSVLTQHPVFSLTVTMICIAGVSHSTNLIDGCNGLSSGVCFICFAAIAAIAVMVGDAFILFAASAMGAATLGFFLWNFPFGRIFLGDAGAYMLGFLLSTMCVLLVARNPEVSPWSMLLIMIYPVWETLFSAIRRGQHKLSSIGKPDSLHLHQLIHSRAVRRYGVKPIGQNKLKRNASTSVYLWALVLMSAVPAVMFWDNNSVSVIFVIVFVATYTFAYRALVQFRFPGLFKMQASKHCAFEPQFGDEKSASLAQNLDES